MSELMPLVSDPEVTQSRCSLNGDRCGEGLRAGSPLQFCSWPCMGLDTGGDAAEGEEEPLPLHLGTRHCEVFLPPAVVGRADPTCCPHRAQGRPATAGPGQGKLRKCKHLQRRRGYQANLRARGR